MQTGQTDCVSWVLKEQGADWLRPVPERPEVREEEDRWAYDADHSNLPVLVASGAAWSNVSEPAFLSSEARCATLTHPEVRRRKKCT